MWINKKVKNLIKSENLPIFCKKFTVKKALKECILDVSALGIFCIKINGQSIDDYFMPGWTNYNKYVNLCRYDITHYLKEENLIEITLSDGWFSGRLGYTMKANVYGKDMALFATLSLTYQDGETSIIQTDDTWRVAESNIVISSLFDGETVDFRVKNLPYERLPFANPFDYEIAFELYDYEPVRKITELTPTVMYQDEKVIKLDFHQNFAGFLTFEVEGAVGTELTIRHAEVLDKDGSFYYENLRSVKATDKLILSGGKDVFDPKFTFHGFRYAEIAVTGKVKISNVRGIALSQDIQYGGEFTCSDEIVNAVYKNALWGQKGNFITIPTDCPQRDERLGWTGDAQVFCNSAMYNSDCNAFFVNYLKLIRKDILPDGKIPSFVPFFIPVSVSTAGVPGWADAICVIAYTHYLHYQDKNVLRTNLPYAVRHLQYYLSKCEDGVLKVENPFGDWLCTQKANDTESISQCFFGLSAQLIAKMYAILDDRQSAEKYMQIYQTAKQAFRKYFMGNDGKIVGDSQTIYAFALSVGFVSVDEIKTHFIQAIERAGGKLTTGFIGVKYLLPALCQIGETDLAYKIIKETEYPSWGYTIKNGATTIWERWNGYTQENGFETPSMNSFNHYSLGSCVEWLYSHVLGIKLFEKGEIYISPSLSSELTFAKGAYCSLKGKISVEWTYADGVYHLEVNAEDSVEYGYDFKDREIISISKQGNRLQATLK